MYVSSSTLQINVTGHASREFKPVIGFASLPYFSMHLFAVLSDKMLEAESIIYLLVENSGTALNSIFVNLVKKAL